MDMSTRNRICGGGGILREYFVIRWPHNILFCDFSFIIYVPIVMVMFGLEDNLHKKRIREGYAI